MPSIYWGGEVGVLLSVQWQSTGFTFYRSPDRILNSLSSSHRTTPHWWRLLDFDETWSGGTVHHPKIPWLEKNPLGPEGGFLGHLIFLHRGKSPADFSHDWAWIKNFLGWPGREPKPFPKLRQKFLDPALFWSSWPLGKFLGPRIGMSPQGFPT